MAETSPPEETRRSLLPEGLRDDLPPWAEYEAGLVDRLMARFAAHGYERVAPPLVEFEEGLLAGAGASQAAAMFRLQDPESHRMMALRADMTPQVARIATTRLAKRPRPLRLSYAGHVLRVRGTELRPARQFRQAGVELIGAESLEADLEVILLAAGALASVGVKALSVDLVSPTFVPALAADLGLDEAAREIARRALDAKDIAALGALEEGAFSSLKAVMDAGGAITEAVPRLRALPLGERSAPIRDRLVRLAEALAERNPDLSITLDPGEMRGFEYHTGIGFAFFVPGVLSEIGRGGRYRAVAAGGGAEEAVGFSMYLDSLLRAVPPPEPARRLFLPFGTDRKTAERLREEGWRTVAALEESTDAEGEARRLGCTHVLTGEKAVAITRDGG